VAEEMGASFIEFRNLNHQEFESSVDKSYFTLILKIRDPTTLWDQLRKSMRRYVKKSMENNLEVVLSSRDVVQFYSIYSRHMRDVEKVPKEGIVLEGKQGIGHLLPLSHLDVHHRGDCLLGYDLDCRLEINSGLVAARLLAHCRLRDGSRVNAIIPPLALTGPTLTIRKFRKERFKINDLIALNTLDPLMAQFLQACVLCRRNMIVSSITGR
jgi:hypothetical protein